MALPSGPARPVRVALDGSVSPADACLLVRGDEVPGTFGDRGLHTERSEQAARD